MTAVDANGPERTCRAARERFLHTSARTFCYALGTLGLLASGGLAAAAVRSPRRGPWPAPAEPESAVSRWPARRLAAAPSPAPGVDWDALTHAYLTLTPRQLDSMRRDWRFDDVATLHSMAAGTPHVVWGSVGRPLFGPADAGLQGGAAGASQLAVLDEDLMGREVEEVGLTRFADLGEVAGPEADAERAVPSLRFDIWMQRLGDIRCGGLEFRPGGQLPNSPAYDAGARLARYADGNVSAVFHGHGVRVRTGQCDVVLLERLPYGVVGLRYAEPTQPGGPRRPEALTLMAGTGFTYDPREAAAYADDPYGYTYDVTQVPGAFELPLAWVERLAEKGFFA